mmetsp:Transcript_11163/g.19080  ORF Transcript_11163/g.19080 Transcript_11163/m.19080 type:complete len:284 (-) Transcript_11163:605-1456(-)
MLIIRRCSRLLPELLERRVCLRVLLHDLSYCHFKVLLSHVHPALTQREHARFCAHRLHLRARGATHFIRNLLQVDSPHQIHLAGVDLQNIQARRLGGVGELDFAIDASRTEQRRVQKFHAVSCHQHLNFVGGLKTVQLVEKLEHRALNFRVTASAAALHASRADGIDLVHENDRRGVLPGHDEQLANHPGSLPDVLLHQLRARDTNERAVCVMRNSASKQRLASARRAEQKDSLRLCNTKTLKQLRMLDWKLDHLFDFLDLLVESSDHVEGRVRDLLDLHQAD